MVLWKYQISDLFWIDSWFFTLLLRGVEEATFCKNLTLFWHKPNLIYYPYNCREIIKEIQRLRIEQEKQAKLAPDGSKHHGNPTLLTELRLLRQRRDELEARMSALQESRKELMVQLEGLMKLLKVKFYLCLELLLVCSTHTMYSRLSITRTCNIQVKWF